ncbi:MAG: hypothetical protein WC341_00605 [Bacteroidales bacterium]|jgi:hypothetical protein
MSACTICGKENNSGGSICDRCWEDQYLIEEWYKEQAAQDAADWERRCEDDQSERTQ